MIAVGMTAIIMLVAVAPVAPIVIVVTIAGLSLRRESGE